MKLTVTDVLLGEGFSSRVYKGYLFKRRVAVKTFRPTEKAREQFRREISILAQLSHPSIPRILCSLDDGRTPPMIVLDYCSGITLTHALKTRMVSKALVPTIIMTLLEVMKYLHSVGVLHRDMKPSNVMLTLERRHSLRVYVIDFGLATTLPVVDDRIVGTTGFIAPEVLTENRYSMASDMYALGKTLECILVPADAWWPLLVESCSLSNAKARPSAEECLSFVKKTPRSESSSTTAIHRPFHLTFRDPVEYSRK
jgi:serine/threonine-protein kinase